MTATGQAPAIEPTPGRDRQIPGAAVGPTAALILLAACAIGIAVAGRSPLPAWLLTALIPGLALSPFMPAAARRSSASALVAAVVASACFWPIAVPLIALLGIPIGAPSLLGSAAILAVCCLAASSKAGTTTRPQGTEIGDWAGLAIALAVAAWIAGRAFHDPPLGSDWGHYWRFADAIVGTGSLDAVNTGWMGGGLPFGDYPGLPSVLAAWLSIAGQSASSAPALAGVLYCGGVAAAWLAVRSCWGSQAAFLAGVAAALMPPTITTLGWSGLALSLSLILAVPLIATVSALSFARGGELRRLQLATAGLAVATVSAQPLTAIVIGGALVAYLLLSLVRTRAAGLRSLATTAALTLLLAVPVLADYRDRLGRLGIAQDYTDFLTTRVSWSETLSGGLLPAVLVAVSLIGLIVALQSSRTRQLALVSLLAIACAVAYSESWRIEFAGEYRRAVYLMAPVLAIGFGGLAALAKGLRPSVRMVAAGVLIAGLALTARDWVQNLERFYLTATPQATRVVTAVGERATARSEAIVTDSCWSFPTLGLTDAKVYAGLEPSMIGPRSEREPAARARAILSGGRDGRQAAERLAIRWAIVNPVCPTPTGQRLSSGLPEGFAPIARSRTLLIGYREAR